MALIEKLKNFFVKTVENDFSKYDNNQEFHEILFGEDPYYILLGHHTTIPPHNKDLYKFWVYNGKFKKKSEWGKLGFEIRNFNPIEEGYSTEDNITYCFKPISNELAEKWKVEKKDQLNLYEEIQKEKESNKITSENTIYWIKHHSGCVLSSLNYTPATVDIEDIKITFNDIIESLNYLKDYEHCENFFELSDLKEKPSIMFDEIINDFESYLLKIIENAKNYVVEKTSKMKTNEGKINNLNKFKESLKTCQNEINHEISFEKLKSIEGEIDNVIESQKR